MSHRRLISRVLARWAGFAASRTKPSIAASLGASVLALVLAHGAAASAMKDVVPKSGTFAGQPYPYWMTRAWQLRYSDSAPSAQECRTVTVDGKAVTLVGSFKGAKRSKVTCDVPAGSAVYVNAYTTRCATLPGEHPGFGASPAELRKCSLGVNKYTVRVGINAWLDGRQVALFGHDFWTGTPVFTVTAHGEEAEAAAWGWSLLLTPLRKGTHTVRIQVKTPSKQPLTESEIALHVR
jgi:hypothetical protein